MIPNKNADSEWYTLVENMCQTKMIRVKVFGERKEKLLFSLSSFRRFNVKKIL